MGWATVAEVRALVRTVENDAQVESILSISRKEITAVTGTITGEIPVILSLAHLYLSAAQLLRFMQSNGEMAYFNKMADTQTYNQIEPAIEHFMKLYHDAMRKYRVNSMSSSAGGFYQIIHNRTEDV